MTDSERGCRSDTDQTRNEDAGQDARSDTAKSDTANDVSRAGVVGAGVMGRDIAALLAAGGYDVTLVDADPDALAAAASYLADAAPEALAEAGYERTDVADRIATGDSVDALAGCEFVVEAVPESLDLKRDVVADLEAVLDADAVVGTNTSALSAGDLAATAAHPERVVLFHFAKPAIRRDLVEVAGDAAAGWAIERAVAVGEAIGKEPVVFDRERRANGLSRLSAAIKCAASWELERASAAAIDRGARAMGFETGPFELVDSVGLDVHLATVDNLHDTYEGRFDPPAAVRERMESMVEAGHRGQKDGQGFFPWDDDEATIPEADPTDVQPILAALVAEANRMVDDGVADRETVDRVLRLGSAGDVGPFDVEAMVGAEHLQAVLSERYDETGASIYEPV